jgi:pimeloyl-ACP methyl ester carboxylesterase
MSDPSLAERLARIAVPALVISGESDRVVDPEYGRAYAAAIPNAKFQLLPNAGHFPQIETPEQLLAAIWSFVDTQSTSGIRQRAGSH